MTNITINSDMMDTDKNTIAESAVETAAEAVAEGKAVAEAAAQHPASAMTAADVLGQIERLLGDNAYLQSAIGALTNGQSNLSEAQARALSDIVRCRETTNQQALSLYEKIYQDLRVPAGSRAAVLVRMLEVARLADGASDEAANSISEVFDTVRQIMRENFKSN